METMRDELLEFWFGDSPDDAEVAAAQAELWWSHRAELDEELQARFGSAASAAAAGVIDHWVYRPQGRLALILLLDQLPRAIHRGTPEAFAQDTKAREIAHGGLNSGAHKLLRPIQRAFFYMPFQHSEELEDQDLGLELYRDLAASVSDDLRQTFADFVDHAARHREVIARFGRFPHRNIVLGRISTAEELEFLEEPGSSF
jgi:uncharacterized protein (DUF924 family)